MACVKLDGNADAVEFCPTPPHFNVLAAATYTLQEASAEQAPWRLGTLSLFTFPDCGDLELYRTDTLQTCGIFDIKWRPPSSSPTPPLLAQAGADGSLALYNLQVLEPFHLCELIKDNISSSMCLSLDWNPLSKEQISISHSDGGLSVVDIRESNVEVSQHRGNAHSFESWCVAYDPWRPDILYSGGDDCHFCGWDARAGLIQPVFREKKVHHMGVCSIQGSPHEVNHLATGSYDEKLRIWDTRMLSQPIAEKVLALGGGVWKLKWSPFDKDCLVAACMHNGFMVVKMQGDELVLAMEYKKHQSLAYGVDWFRGPSKAFVTQSVLHDAEVEKREAFVGNLESSLPLVASCSFYDCSLHLWKPHFPL
ncbi:hypothetical protein GOP47_0020156 [Adiantum capillus-veneris]|uniref:methylated diphthine methylhydrolase n=1 Tax=Adiantum capillus-veneris TaxID=13818 RepID=A0A9D4UE04_ADICA|nr:hypothetical protein GOP47_0020156 [Adiantum capillus-veneris]